MDAPGSMVARLFDRASGERVPIQPQPGLNEEPFIWNWDSPLLISPELLFAAGLISAASLANHPLGQSPLIVVGRRLAGKLDDTGLQQQIRHNYRALTQAWLARKS